MNEKENTIALWMIGMMTALAFVMVFCFGWMMGHTVISRECTKIGAFYVGDKVYECKVKQ